MKGVVLNAHLGRYFMNTQPKQRRTAMPMLRWLLSLSLIGCATSAWSYNISLDCHFILGHGLICMGEPLPNTGDRSEQHDYQFEVRTGDINYDGRQDIYLARTSGPSANGVIHKTILFQQSNNSFAPLPASNDQLGLAADWPRSSIRTIVADYNADGFVDVMLKNVAGTIGGQLNQVVFSNKSANGRAAAVTAVTNNYKKTFRSLAAQRRDPSYFSRNVVTRIVTAWLPRFTCGGWSIYERRCYFTWIKYRRRVRVYDPNKISLAAVLVKNTIDAVVNTSKSKKAASRKVGKILATVLGETPGGLCNQDPLIRLEYADPDNCRGYELFRILATNSNAEEEEINRPKDQVNITFHGLIWRDWGPDHLALEFYNSRRSWGNKILRTLSAGSENGLLTKSYNRSSDESINNLLAAPVQKIGLTPEKYFNKLIALQDKYKNNLNYDLWPGLYSDGYNSNSYVAGLVAASGGLTVLNFDDYVGGDKPVPASEFQ